MINSCLFVWCCFYELEEENYGNGECELLILQLCRKSKMFPSCKDFTQDWDYQVDGSPEYSAALLRWKFED